jgi:pimeloyl-ACP methyl ester carboxylesterase
MASRPNRVRKKYEAVSLPIWLELLAGVEMLTLRVSPVYWGYGVPQGDGSAVVVVPGFLLTDLYLTEFRAWLGRIGYRPYGSGIGINADCPNLLIKRHLVETVETAYAETKKKVHMIGHSLGGVLARAIASQMPSRVASVITLGAPFRGVSVHPMILRAVNLVRGQIHERNAEGVLPACYTGACTCQFLESLVLKLSRSVRQTAVYTKTDGIVDWKVCKTGNRASDFEVSGTHIGMVFNPMVYDLVARRLAGKRRAA